jgi:hypothetical protein
MHEYFAAALLFIGAIAGGVWIARPLCRTWDK